LKAVERVLDDSGELGEIAEPDVAISAPRRTSCGIRRHKSSSYVSQ
jgi:hypothetical protein